MKSSTGIASALACGAILLAACSTPVAHREARVAAPAAAAAPAPADEVIADTAGGYVPPAPSGYTPFMPRQVIVPLPQGMDKFPDKTPNKAVLVSEQPVST